jgi:hypothetical protein
MKAAKRIIQTWLVMKSWKSAPSHHADEQNVSFQENAVQPTPYFVPSGFSVGTHHKVFK